MSGTRTQLRRERIISRVNDIIDDRGSDLSEDEIINSPYHDELAKSAGEPSKFLKMNINSKSMKI